MTEDRFRTLAAAYGAALERWPADERSAAAAFAVERPGLAAVLLGRERALDAALDAAEVAAPNGALGRRVIEAAPGARAAARRWRWLMGAGLGLGLAGAGAAGVAAGLILTPASVVRVIGGAPSEPPDDVAALVAPAGEPAGV